MRKNVLAVLAAVVLISLFVFTGCSKSEAKTTEAAPAAAAPAASAPVAAKYADGIYFAADDAFASSGWKETRHLTVSVGRLFNADLRTPVNIAGWVLLTRRPTTEGIESTTLVKFGNARPSGYSKARRVAEAYLPQDPGSCSDQLQG